MKKEKRLTAKQRKRFAPLRRYEIKQKCKYIFAGAMFAYLTWAIMYALETF